MIYRLTKAASEDLLEIWNYIATDNLTAADKLIDDIYEAFDLLAENPEIGRKNEPIGKHSFRFWTVRKRYHVIYRNKQEIEIARVLNGYRDIFTILSSQEDLSH
jgi:toxin ParE1/3/4